MTNDILERFTFENKPLRGEHVYLSESIQTILKQHPYPKGIERLLAESLAIVSLLSAMIKLEGRITLRFQGKNNLKLLLAQCNHHHEIRGLIKYDHEHPVSYDELMQLMKDGLLAVMLEFDAHPFEPYHGIVEWRGDNLTSAIESYFETSEQLLTKIWLHYNSEQQSIVGCMLQALPNHDLEDTHHLAFFQIAEQMQNTWKQYSNDLQFAKEFLTRACPHDDIRLFAPIAIQFKCTCSRAHSEQAIKLLGSKEALDEIEKNGEIVVTCDFCAKTYRFDQVDITALFKDPLNDSSGTVH